MPTAIALPLTFEQERDELLAHYEGSSTFRPTGDYTAEQFEGQYHSYFHRLMGLLDSYALKFPHLRDALGLELSRTKRSKHCAIDSLTYEFDGLLLPERLARRVGRLKLPSVAQLFPALDPLNANYATKVACQQRYHYSRALALAHQLAHSATRACLTTPAVVSALQCLRAFGLSDNRMQQYVVGLMPAPALGAWWHQCGLNEDRNALRSATRAWQQALFCQYEHTNVSSLTLSQAREQVQAAITSTGDSEFSPTFYARYFACAALPVPYHDRAARICLGVAALYSLPEDALSVEHKKAVLDHLRELTAPQLADYEVACRSFFEELQRQVSPGGAEGRLARHLSFGRWAKAPGLLHDFYQVVGTYLDAEEEADVPGQLRLLCHAIESNQSLSLASAELAACSASVCRSLYDRLNFKQLNDQETLRQLYRLLLPSLPTDEVEILEVILLDQASADAQQAELWLAGPTLLAERLRQGLRERLSIIALTVGSNDYEHLKHLLVSFSSVKEAVHNNELFAMRYDASYFMLLA